MIYSSKPFLRRPWERGDDGLIRHFDGITVKNLSPPLGNKAFYLCLHTSCTQLAENKIPCDTPNGWVWPDLYIENFSVEATKDVIGVYVGDGIVPGIKFRVTVRDGIFSNMLGITPIISVNYINFSELELVRLKCVNCQTPKIEIRNCTIGCLRIFDLEDVHFEIIESQINRVEMCNSDGITFTGAIPEPIKLPSTLVGVVGSFAVIVSVDGRLFRGDASNIEFREFKKP